MLEEFEWYLYSDIEDNSVLTIYTEPLKQTKKSKTPKPSQAKIPKPKEEKPKKISKKAPDNKREEDIINENGFSCVHSGCLVKCFAMNTYIKHIAKLHLITCIWKNCNFKGKCACEVQKHLENHWNKFKETGEQEEEVEKPIKIEPDIVPITAFKTPTKAKPEHNSVRALSDSIVIRANSTPSYQEEPKQPKPSKPEAKIASKPELRSISKPEPKITSNPEPKITSKPEPKIISKPEPKFIQRLEPKFPSRPEPKIISKPELIVNTKPDLKNTSKTPPCAAKSATKSFESIKSIKNRQIENDSTESKTDSDSKENLPIKRGVTAKKTVVPPGKKMKRFTPYGESPYVEDSVKKEIQIDSEEENEDENCKPPFIKSLMERKKNAQKWNPSDAFARALESQRF